MLLLTLLQLLLTLLIRVPALQVHISCSSPPCDQLDTAINTYIGESSLHVIINDSMTYSLCSSNVPNYNDLQITGYTASVECPTASITLSNQLSLTLVGLSLLQFSDQVVDLQAGTLSIVNCSSNSLTQALVTSAPTSTGNISISESSFYDLSHDSYIVQLDNDMALSISTTSFTNCGEVIFSSGTSTVITNSSFNGNDVAIDIEDSNLLLIENCHFEDNGASSFAVLVDSVSSVVIRKCNFTLNAGVLDISYATTNISECVFNANYANRGPAIWMYDSILTISSTMFDRNEAYYSGGSIITYYGNLSIEDCVFSSNYADQHGGAISNWDGTVTIIERSTFIYNEAADAGASLFLRYNLVDTIIDDCIFYGNFAKRGGAIFSDYRAVGVRNSVFEKNSASQHTGGLYVYQPNGQMKISNCTFTDSNGGSSGGALSIYDGIDVSSSVIIQDSVFTRNTANRGGAAVISSTDVTFIDSVFDSNFASEAANGGAITDDNSNIVITRCNFTGNYASWNGGAMEMNSKTLRIHNSTFTDNDAGNSGGTIIVTSADPFEVHNSVFSGSSSGAHGGAIYIEAVSNTLLENCMFIDSQAIGSGGGLHIADSSNAVIKDCVFNQTRTSTSGGSLSCHSSSIKVSNCLFLDANASSKGGVIRAFSGSEIQIIMSNFSRSNASNGGVAYIDGGSIGTITESIFENNYAILGGGVLYADTAVVDIEDSVFRDNHAGEEGGVLYMAASQTTFYLTEVSMSNSIVFGNTAGVNGGFSRVYIDASLDITSMTVSNCSASYGGALFVTGVLSSNQIVLESNYATKDGGAIYASISSELDLIDILIVRNNAEGRGSAVFAEESTAVLQRITIEDNDASRNSSLYIEDSTYTIDTFVLHNHHGSARHAFTIWNSQVDLTDCTVSEIIVEISPFLVTESSVLSITGGMFRNNGLSRNLGGAMMINNSDVTIMQTDFINHSAILGGSLILENSIVSMVECTVSLSTASKGGAIFIEDSILNTIRCDFIDNVANSTGGCLHISGLSAVTMEDSVIRGAQATEFGGAVFMSEDQMSRLSMSNVRLEENSASIGNVIYAEQGSQVVLLNVDVDKHTNSEEFGSIVFGIGINMSAIDCSFSDNINIAVYLEDSRFVAVRSLFSRNVASSGSALYALKSAITLESCTISENTCTDHGGAFLIKNTEMEVYESSFVENNGLSGASIVAYNNSILDINSCTFSRNIAQNAGAVEAIDTTVTILNSIFDQNQANTNGGALHVMNTTIEINEVTFTTNTAGNKGGAIYIDREIVQDSKKLTITIENSEFHENQANSGGAVYSSLDMMIMNTLMSRNQAEISGGAVYFTDSAMLTMKEVYGVNNYANFGNGGMIYLEDSQLEIFDSDLDTNSVISGSGGFLFAIGSVVNCSSIICSNNEANRGGCISLENTEILILNSTISGNMASHGGGIYVSDNSTLPVMNSLIVENFANIHGGGIYTTEGVLLIDNCAFIENLAGDIFSQDEISCSTSGSGAAIYSDTYQCESYFFDSEFMNNTARSAAAVLAASKDPQLCFQNISFDTNKLVGNLADIAVDVYLLDESFNLVLDLPESFNLGSNSINRFNIINENGYIFGDSATKLVISSSNVNLRGLDIVFTSDDEFRFTFASSTTDPETILRTNITFTASEFEPCGVSASTSIEISIHTGICPVSQGIRSITDDDGVVLFVCDACEVGRYSGSPSEQYCKDCEIGRYSNMSGMYECWNCSLGSFAIEGSTSCTECIAGFYAAEIVSECEICPEGRYNSDSGSSRCIQCIPGRYAIEGFTSCIECKKGFFSSTNASESCKSCAEGRFGDMIGSSVCQECVANATTIDYASENQMNCVCQNGFYGRAYDGSDCLPCPGEGFLCPQNSSVPFIEAGFYRTDLSDESHSCIPSEACLSGGYGDTICNMGYDGTFCSKCAYSYYRSGLQCRECGSNFVKFVVFSVGSVLIGYGTYTLHQQNRITKDARIIINSFQVISLYPSASSSWPSGMLALFRISSIAFLDIDVLSVECTVEVGYWTKWRMRLLMPIIAFGGLYASALVFHFFQKEQDRNGIPIRFSSRRPVLVKTFIFIILLMFAMLVSSIFEPFNCSKQPNGRSSMVYNSSLECYSDEWYSHLPEILVAFLMYLVIYPGFLLYILFSFRKNLQSEAFKMHYGILTRSYADHAYYWELVDIVFKATIVMIRDFSAYFASAASSIFFIVAVIIFYMTAHSVIQPYKDPSRNRLATLWNSVTLIVLLSVVAFSSANTSTSETMVYTVLMISLVIVALIITVKSWYGKITQQNQRAPTKQSVIQPRAQYNTSIKRQTDAIEIF